jgi:hypothetical protein
MFEKFLLTFKKVYLASVTNERLSDLAEAPDRAIVLGQGIYRL